MRILILLYCVWLTSADSISDKCDGVTFNGKYYNREIILGNIAEASDFSYDKGTNTLFFSHLYQPKEYNPNYNHYRSIAYYNIDTKEYKDLLEIYGGWTTAMNPETKDIYLGGVDGIFKFNSLNKTAEPYAAKGVQIWCLHYSKVLYYTTYPDLEVYSYDGKESKRVLNFKVLTIVESNDKFYFTNSTGLFKVSNDKNKAELITESKFYYTYNAVTKDKNNDIFVPGKYGIYKIDEENKRLHTISPIEVHNNFIFDENNNVIYSNDNNIYRLTPSEAKCPLVQFND